MSVQKYRVFQSRLIVINDDSVFNIACHSVVVTHADYRALEHMNKQLKKDNDALRERLAGLELDNLNEYKAIASFHEYLEGK